MRSGDGGPEFFSCNQRLRYHIRDLWPGLLIGRLAEKELANETRGIADHSCGVLLSYETLQEMADSGMCIIDVRYCRRQWRISNTFASAFAHAVSNCQGVAVRNTVSSTYSASHSDANYFAATYTSALIESISQAYFSAHI